MSICGKGRGMVQLHDENIRLFLLLFICVYSFARQQHDEIASERVFLSCRSTFFVFGCVCQKLNLKLCKYFESLSKFRVMVLVFLVMLR